MVNSLYFYNRLPCFRSFEKFVEFHQYRPLPEDWYVVLTDVTNSTEAIEAGRYKEVNIVAVLALTAIQNIDRRIQIPFLFGGDGITVFVPAAIVPSVKDILAANRQLAKETFGLNLRCGLIPIKDIYATGQTLNLAKQRVSSRYQQVFTVGNGLDYAEKMLKSPEGASSYLLPDDYMPQISPDFTGFLCPFSPVMATKGEIISLIVKSQRSEIASQSQIYREVLQIIKKTLGELIHLHPITIPQLKRTQNSEQIKLMQRANARLWNTPFRPLLKLMLFLLGLLPSRLNPVHQMSVLLSDYKKFDGALKMTLACSSQQRQQLASALEQLKQNQQIFYGIHCTSHALITCSIGLQEEVHLVDATDGGYALAAKQLKAQIKAAN